MNRKIFLILYLTLNPLLSLKNASNSVEKDIQIPFITKYKPLLKLNGAEVMDDSNEFHSSINGRQSVVEVDSVRIRSHCFTMDADGHTLKVMCYKGATHGFDSKAKLVFRTKGDRIEERSVSDYTRTSIDGIIDGQEETSHVRGRFSDGVFQGIVSTDRDTYYVEPKFRYGPVKKTGHSISVVSSSIIYKESDVTLCPDSFESDEDYNDEVDEDENEHFQTVYPEVEDYDDQNDDLPVTPDDEDIYEEEEYHPRVIRRNQKQNIATTPSTRPKRPVIVYSMSQRKRPLQCSIDKVRHPVIENRLELPTTSRKDHQRHVISTNPARGPIGTKCLVKVWADNSFFEKYAMRDRSVTVATIQTIISEVDRTFSQIDFDGDGKKDGFSIKIGHLEVLEDLSKHGSGFLFAENDPDTFLNSIQDESLDDFCLGIVITYKDFGGSLGQAYGASSAPNKMGGICSKRITLRDGFLENHNTLFVTLMGGQGNTVPLAAATMTTVHLMGHSWGSRHDSDVTGSTHGAHAPICSMDPMKKTSSYIMGNGRFRSGTFSKCSVRDMKRIIETKGICLM